jgi:hypothetical protein
LSRTTLIVLIVLAVVLAVVVLLVVRRRRYIQALTARGWAFESSPQLAAVLDHHVPPFGLGFERKVDESIIGRTAAGVPFHVFEYACRAGGPSFDQRLASLWLPVALPPLFVDQGAVRAGVDLPPVPVDPSYWVRTADPRLAEALFTPAVRAAVGSFGRLAGRLDLSIDGNHLVAVGAPKDPDQLAAYLEALGAVVTALDVPALTGFAVPPAPAYFGFYGRPDWVLVQRDDSLIEKYSLTRAGSHHTTEQIVRGTNDGLPIEAFVHRWQTSRTETSTDSEGRTTTRTVTEQHSENVMAVWLPVALPQLSVNGGWGGERVRFESEPFNDSFKVRTSTPKFAYDVIHPRMMEFLAWARPPGFGIGGHLMRFTDTAHDTLVIGRCADFAHEFLARVPSFVWRDLGVEPPRFRSSFSS